LPAGRKCKDVRLAQSILQFAPAYCRSAHKSGQMAATLTCSKAHRGSVANPHPQRLPPCGLVRHEQNGAQVDLCFHRPERAPYTGLPYIPSEGTAMTTSKRLIAEPHRLLVGTPSCASPPGATTLPRAATTSKNQYGFWFV
jgi:hypothetical protein